jgi:2',3'-cyclic-nucleotide 2'-phosphodiesterase (5'-nucleotidase family)
MQLKMANPNTIVMNIGDTYHGGAEALFSNGNDIVDAVNTLGIDVGVPGNWDYAYGPTITNARFGAAPQVDVKRPSFPMLAANAIYRDPPNITQPFIINIMRSTFNYTPGTPFLPASTIIEKSGVKIGIIGLTSDIVERMHETMAFNIEFTQGLNNYKDLIETNALDLRNQGSNLVIVMSELGIHKDKEIADILQQNTVDIVFSAHTHELTASPLQSNSGALLVESGNDTWLGQMDVDFDANNIATQFHWTLHPIVSSITPDNAMATLVQNVRAPYLLPNPNLTIPTVFPAALPSNLQNLFPQPFPLTLDLSLEHVLASTSIALDRKNALESHFNNAFTDMLKQWNNADVAMTPGFRFDSPVVPTASEFTGDINDYIWNYEDGITIKGNVLIEDAYRFFPAPFTIAQGQVTVARLKEVIEENLENVFSQSAFNQSGGWVDGFSGLNMTVDICQNLGNKLIQLEKPDGTPLQDSDILDVTGCARPFDQNATTTLCSYDGFSNVVSTQHPDGVTGDLSAVDFFIYALQNNLHSNISPRSNIADQNNTTQWPVNSFVQPLTVVCLADDIIFSDSFE